MTSWQILDQLPTSITKILNLLHGNSFLRQNAQGNTLNNKEHVLTCLLSMHLAINEHASFSNANSSHTMASRNPLKSETHSDPAIIASSEQLKSINQAR
jgi:hypothetical protein